MLTNEIAHCSSVKSPNESWFYRSVPLRKNCTSNISKRVQKTYEKFKEKPLPPIFKTRLDGPSATWKVFSRLQMATNYADSSTKGCMVFSFEEKVSNSGQRMFLVAHPEQMWQKHRARQLDERCSYEVIRENSPCKLYFDLEFYTCFNSNKNGNSMTEIFIKCIIAAMFEQHNLILRESDFLWLDASTAEKFSSHLILQMENAAFQNNIFAGTFVSLLTTTLRLRIDENRTGEGLWPSVDEIKTLLVKSKKEKEIFFCDEGVYSKNRNFRMFLSTKQGKKSPLLVSAHNKYVPPFHIKYNEEEAIFYDSLITFFRDQEITRFLNYEEKIHSQSLPSNSFSKRRKFNKPGVSSNTSSPFPNLDNFVTRIISDGYSIGFIRKWTYICNEQKIIYDIGNYRYCSNIGRHHKSNNIKIVVDMKCRCYYQTCLDPECRQEGYRSEVTAIPEDILFLNVPDEFFNEDCFSQLQRAENELENCSDDFFNTDCFSQLQCTEKKVENCSDVSKNPKKLLDITNRNCFKDSKASKQYGQIADYDAIWMNDVCQDWTSNFGDFSQLIGMNNPVKGESHVATAYSNSSVNQNYNQLSWDAFFLEDFPSTEHKRSEEKYDIDENFPILDDISWSIESATKDSTECLGNVSLEEEMLMAEAAEAAEVTINESIFSEETVF